VAYIAQWPCNSIAIGQALHVEGENTRIMDSQNKALNQNSFHVKAKTHDSLHLCVHAARRCT